MNASAPATNVHDVSARMIAEMARVCPFSVRRYVKRGLLPAGRKREGVRGRFWTVAQANRCLRLLGRKERIEIED